MTHHELAELLRDHVANDEPPMPLPQAPHVHHTSRGSPVRPRSFVISTVGGLRSGWRRAAWAFSPRVG